MNRTVSRAVVGLLFSGSTVLLLAQSPAPSAISCCMSETEAYREQPLEIIRKRFEFYKTIGVDSLRGEGIGWRSMEKVEGKWVDPKALPYLRLAGEYGFHIKMNVGTISSPPDWFFAEHPEARLINQNGTYGKNTLSYWYPGLHELLVEKTDRLFRYMAENHLLEHVDFVDPDFGPASEPLYPVPWVMGKDYHDGPTFWCYDANAQADFIGKMQAKYGTIEDANKRWKTSFTSWDRDEIPKPKTRPGAMWDDVLTWYRDSKREFVLWQIRNFWDNLKKYIPDRPIDLILYIPGREYTEEAWRQAVATGDGAPSLKSMCDSTFLMETAAKEHCCLQYTASEDEAEIAHLRAYMKEHGFGNIPMWGENGGNAKAAGDPMHLAEVIVRNGLCGLDYTHSDFMFEADGVTPAATAFKLKEAYAKIRAFVTSHAL